MPKKVPLVIYEENGTRKVVGEAEIDDAGLYISASITDPDLAQKIFGDTLRGVSIPDEETPEIARHNVFDEDKD